FFLGLCLTSAVVLGSLAVAANPGGGDPAIENTLAVQKAVLQARDHLLQAEPKKAVDVLEANLTRINGDRKYLALLRDAYRSYLKDPSLANQPALADVYQKRLKILEDHEAQQQAAAGPAAASQLTAGPAGAAPKGAVPQSPAVLPAAARPEPAKP